MQDRVKWKPGLKHPAVIEPNENSITQFAPYIIVELQEGDLIVRDGDRYIVIPGKREEGNENRMV